MATTGVIVQSGRFTATPTQLVDALDQHKARLDRTVGDLDSKVILLTEMSPNKYDNALEDWADENGWHLFHPTISGPDECAILSARPLRRGFYLMLTQKRLDPKVTGRTAPLFVTAARPKGDDWFGVWHSPAHNGGLSGNSRAKQVYLSALNGLKRWRVRLGGKPSIGGDWNADPNRQHVFDTITENFPRMKWAGDRGQAPTEGGRVIDGLLTRRRVLKQAKTLPTPNAGFDHKPVIIVLG